MPVSWVRALQCSPRQTSLAVTADRDLPPVLCMEGRCLTDSVVYVASVTETGTGKTETYTGLTGNRFKERYYKHCSDMRNAKDRNNTSLSAHVWSLKDQNLSYSIKWDFIEKAPTFNPVTKKCRLCLKEKYHILYNNNNNSTLNRRQEIFNTCRHRKQRLLANFNTWGQKFSF